MTGRIPARILNAKGRWRKSNQTSQTMRVPPEGLGGVPVRTGVPGEDEDWALLRMIGVPALIKSISRSCFFASIKNR